MVVATGVLPRVVNIPTTTPDCRVKVLSYVDVLRHRAAVGKRVAVIGAYLIDINDIHHHLHLTSM